MGLAVVHGIVESNDGRITVSSEPKKGATFNVFLPAIIYEESQEVESKTDYPKGNETVLLVDDEY